MTGQDSTGNEKKSRAGTCPSGFYIYIGPNIKKHIQTGTIYRGTRAHALKQAAEAIKAYPLVKTLIVSGDALPEARLKGLLGPSLGSCLADALQPCRPAASHAPAAPH